MPDSPPPSPSRSPTSSAPVALLGPQRLQPTVGEAVRRLGVTGRVAVVTAGWQEREAEVGELAEHLLREGECTAVPLELYRRAEEAFTADPELATAHRRRQDDLRTLQRLYQLQLRHRVDAVHALLRRAGPAGLLDPERRLALDSVRRLDAHHRGRLAEIHGDFAAVTDPAARPAIAAGRDELAALLDGCSALAIAGGHVAVLLNRLRLFGLLELAAGLPIIAWSAGAMVLARSLVVFHDRPPQGAGNAEILEVGLDRLPPIQPLPHASRRLLLGDPHRVGLLAHRFPSPVAMDDGGHIVLSEEPSTEGFRLLTPAGQVRPFELEELRNTTSLPTLPEDGFSPPGAESSPTANPSGAPPSRSANGDVSSPRQSPSHEPALPESSFPEAPSPSSVAPLPVAGAGTSSADAWGIASAEEVPAPSHPAAPPPVAEASIVEAPDAETPVAKGPSPEAPPRTLAIRALEASGSPPSAEAIDTFLASHTFPLSEGTTTTFVYRGDAEAVRLRHWIYGLPSTQPFLRIAGTDLWYLLLELPERSRVEYKIEVVEDGEEHWIRDPLNDRLAHDPFGANSVFHGVGYETPAWTRADPDVRRGSFEEVVIDSRAFGDRRHTRVYLPARFRGAGDGSARRYPLIVFHDGEDYARYADLVTVLDNLVERLEIAPPVVALSTPVGDRLEEYGDDPRHARYLAEELLPALEERYPLRRGPAGRGLAGASFGAVASLAAAWRHPGVWGRLLLQSGSFAFSDVGGNHRRGEAFDPVVEFMNRFREEPRRPAEELFLSCGIYESLIYENRSLVPLLQEAGLEVRYREARDGHNWENWRDRLRAGLSWLFPGPLRLVYE